MDRRAFLRQLVGAATVAARPTYFFAPIGGWTSSIIVHPPITFHPHRPDVYADVEAAKEAARLYEFSVFTTLDGKPVNVGGGGRIQIRRSISA
jgi:hypothetical protein